RYSIAVRGRESRHSPWTHKFVWNECARQICGGETPGRRVKTTLLANAKRDKWKEASHESRLR
ncbi:MAG TPA: hypothetical protein VHK27_14220, partial [Gammaproteobacteria bacterium]|nr:hypothetical protein [Gammaproteobacteria bacterium]